MQLAFFDGEVLLGEQLLTEESVLFDQLVRELIGVAGIGVARLPRGRRREPELAPRDADRLARTRQRSRQAGGIERMTAEARLPHVEIGLVGVIEAGPGGAVRALRGRRGWRSATRSR